MFRNIEAIIFDLDGTLIDSMGIWKDIDIEYLAKFGYELPSNLQECLEGKCFHDTAIYFKERFNIKDSIETIENDWNQMAEDKYKNEIFLKDGVIELLKYAKKNNIKLGIATSNSKHLVTTFLKSRKIYDMFDAILTGNETKLSKPNPEVYLKVASLLNISPNKCLVFEDVIPGIMAGKNAGMRVCAVDDTYSYSQREEKLRLADYYIYSYRDIVY